MSVERPGDERFAAASAALQALWEEVAKLSKVPVLRQKLGDAINIVSVHPSDPGAAFAGMSLLIDSRKNELVQWYWQFSRRHPDRDLAAVQTTVWRQLSACTSQAGIAEKQDVDAGSPGTSRTGSEKTIAVVPGAELD